MLFIASASCILVLAIRCKNKKIKYALLACSLVLLILSMLIWLWFLFCESVALIRWFQGLLGKTGYDVFDRRGTDLPLRSLIAFSGNWIIEIFFLISHQWMFNNKKWNVWNGVFLTKNRMRIRHWWFYSACPLSFMWPVK